MKPWVLPLAAFAAVVCCTGLAFWLAESQPELRRSLTIAAAALAGSAGAIAATATTYSALRARDAAIDSARTAALAEEALQRALRPALGLSGWILPPESPRPGEGQVEVQLVGNSPAVDIMLEIVFVNGETTEGRAARLSTEPGGSTSMTTRFSGGPPTRDGFETEGFDRVTLHYSDERRIGRWRQEWVVKPTTYEHGTRPAHWVAQEPVRVG